MGGHVKTAGFVVGGIIAAPLLIWLLYWGVHLYFTKLPWPCSEWRCPIADSAGKDA